MEAGGALLSRAPGRSIIAAGALNGRVRDGNGCLSPARATSQRVRRHGHGRLESGSRMAHSPPRGGVHAAAGREAGKPHGPSERFG